MWLSCYAHPEFVASALRNSVPAEVVKRIYEETWSNVDEEGECDHEDDCDADDSSSDSSEEPDYDSDYGIIGI